MLAGLAIQFGLPAHVFLRAGEEPFENLLELCLDALGFGGIPAPLKAVDLVVETHLLGGGGGALPAHRLEALPAPHRQQDRPGQHGDHHHANGHTADHRTRHWRQGCCGPVHSKNSSSADELGQTNWVSIR